DIIKKSGAWYSYGDTRIGQGRENVRTFLKENSDIQTEIRKQVEEKLGIVRKEEDVNVKA
ncbi:MAG: DNA recombination/repair protein RecA, partial [bacterium]|nr:DNA recombination/repair protein RecA [bacterium]